MQISVKKDKDRGRQEGGEDLVLQKTTTRLQWVSKSSSSRRKRRGATRREERKDKR